MGKRDMAFGASLFFICLFLFNETGKFYSPPNTIAGPAIWPRIILALLALLSIVLIYIGYLKYQKEKGSIKPKEETAEKEGFFSSSNKRVTVAMLVTFVFLFAFQYIGYVVSCLVYFVVVTYILEPVKGAKPFFIRLAQASVLAAFIYLVFAKGLNVRLPHGILPQNWFS